MADSRSTAEIAYDLTKLIVDANKGTGTNMREPGEILELDGRCFQKIVAEEAPASD